MSFAFWRKKICFVAKQEQGQVLLIVILTMVVALTVGLGVVSRSIVQVKTAKDEADSQKAFSAAEAGIEQVLKTGHQIGTAQSLGNNANINVVTMNTAQSATIVLNNGTQVTQDEGSDVWLSAYPTYQNPWTGRLRIYWGTAAACNEAALEIIVITKPSSYIMTHYAYDPCSSRIIGSGGNNFTIPGSGGTINGKAFNFSVPVDVTNGILVRVVPLYTNTIIAVAGYTNAAETTLSTLPPQGTVITSVGSSGSIQREITYFQGYNTVPTELFYSLYAP